MIHSTVKSRATRIEEPILERVLLQAKQEDQQVQEVLELMGWGGLPAELVIEIKEDIRAFRMELEGLYSSCDPFVEKRRQRVDYWIRLYRSGDCSLQTAISALRVRML